MGTLRFKVVGVTAVLAVLCSCASGPTEKYIGSSSSVGFEIATVDSGKWTASHQAGGKTAKFRLEIDPPTSSSGPFQFGAGRFIAEQGSDATALLVALHKALEAKSLPAGVKRLARVEFQYAQLGANQSQTPDGGFSPTPAGSWMCLKLFLGEGDDEGEVFLNFSPKIGVAEFSIKDPDYGDNVLKVLAAVL